MSGNRMAMTKFKHQYIMLYDLFKDTLNVSKSAMNFDMGDYKLSFHAFKYMLESHVLINDKSFRIEITNSEDLIHVTIYPSGGNSTYFKHTYNDIDTEGLKAIMGDMVNEVKRLTKT